MEFDLEKSNYRYQYKINRSLKKDLKHSQPSALCMLSLQRQIKAFIDESFLSKIC